MTIKTHQEEIMFAFNAGLAIQCFEYANDKAINLSYHEGFDVYTFEDNTSVAISISDSHEITIRPYN